MKHFSPILVSLMVMAPAGSAWAEPCGDTTCGDGYACEREESFACPAIACAPDSECDIVCEPTVAEYCKPISCTSDDQCGDGMVCHTTSYESCSGGTSPACESGRDCGAAPADRAVDVTCVQHTVSQCTPTWQLPCTSDDSCGEGFSCVERENCACSGSPGGSGGGVDPEPAVDLVAPEPPPDAPTSDDAPSSGAAAPASGAGCGCEPSGEFHCVMEHIDCTVDADCPDDWECQASSPGTCWVDSEGNSGCDENEAVHQCFPRAFDVAVDGRGDLVSGPGGTSSEVTTDQAENGALPPQSNANVGDPAAGESGGTVEPTSKQAGGCHVASSGGSSGAPGGLAALLALALGAVFGRRRARSH